MDVVRILAATRRWTVQDMIDVITMDRERAAELENCLRWIAALQVRPASFEPENIPPFRDLMRQMPFDAAAMLNTRCGTQQLLRATGIDFERES